MNNLSADKNRRILIIDDNRAIHDDFRKILSPTRATDALDVTEAELFGKAVPPGGVVQQIRYEIDSAYQGQDGVLLVKQALEAGRPYAMAFVDVRMPPGMDGVETIGKIWELDPDLQIVMCTAYSDYSWSQMFEKLGRHDGLLILKKPFDTVEALQLAQALTEKWWLHQLSRRKMEVLEDRVARRTGELQFKTALLEAQVNSSGDGILVVDLQGKKVIQNQRVADLFKIPKAVADGNDDAAQVKWVTDAVKNPGPFADHVAHLYSHPDVISRDEIELKDGTILDRYSAPVVGKDGKNYGRIWTFHDITGRKRAEEALQREHNLLRTLIDHIPDSIYVRDLSNRFVVANAAFARLMGAAGPAALIGRRDADFYPPEMAANFDRIDQEVFAGRPIFNRERVLRFPNGQQLVTLNTKVPFKNDKGEVIGLIGVGRDITERKRLETELNRERDLWRTLLDNSPDHIYFKDTQSRFIKSSKAQGRQFGVESPDEMVGKSDFDFFTEAHARPAFEDEQEIIRTGRPIIDKEEREVWKDGHVTWASSTKMPMRDAAGKIVGIMGISRDITERKRLETHLIQSQKMETVGKLAGGIAHEFNSILTAIIGQSELLLGDLPAGSPLANNAAEISRAAERAATLTRQLLAYGRKQFLRPEPLNLNQVITGMSGMLSHLMGEEMVEVTIVPAAGIKTVKADAGQIEQVIINLAMNARDAMPGGGKLTLETANVSFGPDSMGSHPELKPGSYVMLAVSDTGRGMGESVKARAFEPFFTTKDIGQGTGLGLSSCYGIIKQSGGHINLYSEPGRGTTFKVYLPQMDPVPPKSPARQTFATDMPRGTETILLVEDDPALRGMATGLMQRLGYTVLAAANGIEALSLKQQPGVGHVDLLLTDVVMPHMSGKELADRVRALYPHTKILFTSAYTENAITHQGMLDKGVVLLQKPFAPAALAIKVREVLDWPSVPPPESSPGNSDETTPAGSG